MAESPDFTEMKMELMTFDCVNGLKLFVRFLWNSHSSSLLGHVNSLLFFASLPVVCHLSKFWIIEIETQS